MNWIAVKAQLWGQLAGNFGLSTGARQKPKLLYLSPVLPWRFPTDFDTF
jgi:hypothetical protein